MKTRHLILTFWLCCLCLLANAADGTIKILAIGNSFSEDAVEQYLYDLAKADGKTLVIGNAYRGGQSLKSHWTDITEETNSFEYRKIVGGKRTNSKNTALKDIVVDEEWDYITFQQVSQESGMAETYEPWLGQLIDYVKQLAKNKDVKMGLHQTWAYAQDSSHGGFANYGRNQQRMYNAIVDAYNQAKNNHNELTFIIPSGTAIQNVRTSYLGDTMCRDGYHLDKGIGRFTAACTWLLALTGHLPEEDMAKPDNLSIGQVKVALKAARLAVDNPNATTEMDKPLRLAVAGVTHGHLWEVIRRIPRGEFEIVGVWEPDSKYLSNNGLKGKVADDRFYADLGTMLDETQPEAVVAYGSIAQHMQVVEECAPRHIAVMVEKPLATTTKQAHRMMELARKYNFLVLTNYETSWYNTNHEAKRLVDDKAIGNVERINVYDGHNGPIEIGCGKEFTDWLTDPVLNGGGAVIDFGCYGANLATWLLGGKKPESVQAVLQHNKPDKYPKVDDDATILLRYPGTTVQIMGSWCWPMNRKDMYVYGSQGYLYQRNATQMDVQRGINAKAEAVTPQPLQAPYDDSFRYLRAAVRGYIDVKPTDLASIENNVTVVEILNAAIESDKKGKTIKMKK